MGASRFLSVQRVRVAGTGALTGESQGSRCRAWAWPALGGFVPPKVELPPLSSTPACLKLGDSTGGEATGQIKIRIGRKGKRNQGKRYQSERRSAILQWESKSV